MRLYESVFIARQDVSTQLVESLTKDFSAIIENGGGKIHKHEYWGLRALAYRVKKNRKGHYVMLNIEADNDTLREYERIMGLNEDILRFMNISIEEVEEGPSVMMQVQKAERSPRGERSDRGDRGDRGNRGDRGGDRDAKPAPASDADSEAPAETATKADGE
jgi:small subunit ribosomal protein S6